MQNSPEEFEQNDPNLKTIKEILRSEFSPEKIYLFGSRVTGTAHPNSDYDFVVILKQLQKTEKIDLMQKASRLIRKKLPLVKVDLFFYSREEFEEWKTEFNSIAETAFTLGKEIPLER